MFERIPMVSNEIVTLGVRDAAPHAWNILEVRAANDACHANPGSAHPKTNNRSCAGLHDE